MGRFKGFPGNRACGPGAEKHTHIHSAGPVGCPTRFRPGLRHCGLSCMNETIAQHGNGTEGPPEYWADGGCLFHDGSGRPRMAYGSFTDGKTIERFNFSNARTSNEAEYLTLIALLSSLEEKASPTVYCDSKLLIGQLTRAWRVKAENLKPLHKQAKNLLKRTKARLAWIPRGEMVERLGH